MAWSSILYSLAIPPLLAMILYALSAVLPRSIARPTYFAAFCISAFSCLCACASYGVVASVVLRIAGYGGLSQWTVARAFKWTMWATTGISFRVVESGKTEGGRRGGEDALQTRPAVFVGNHQSELDVLMLGCVFPKYISVTAKSSLKYWPFLGWFMALSKTVFIDRTNRTSARAAFDKVAKQMHTDQQSVFIFPEGTRSYAEKPDMLPFKKGAFHLAVQAQVPIVPVVTANYAHVLDVKKRVVKPGVVDISVLPAIPTKGLTPADVDALVIRTRDAMMDELIRLSHVSGAGNGEPLPRATGVDKEMDGVSKRL